MEFGYNEKEVLSMGVQAACEKAYEQGKADGAPTAEQMGGTFLMGMDAGRCATMAAFEAASEVVAVYRNKDHTVLQFADGEKTRVTYHPEYGYAPDDEKAIMAAMLKRLTGNRYIKALRSFTAQQPRNVADHMVARESLDKCDPACTTDPVTRAMYGGSLSEEDEELLQEFHTLDTEPVFDPHVFVSTDPVSQALMECGGGALAGADPEEEE